MRYMLTMLTSETIGQRSCVRYSGMLPLMKNDHRFQVKNWGDFPIRMDTICCGYLSQADTPILEKELIGSEYSP